LVESRRTMIDRVPVIENAKRVWKDTLNMGPDNGSLFPKVGEAFAATGKVKRGVVGNADALLLNTRELVDFAAPYFDRALSTAAR